MLGRLDLQIARVVNWVWPMLLVLRNGCLPSNHLHFHGARQEQLLAFLVVRFAVDRCSLIYPTPWRSNKIVLQMHDGSVAYCAILDAVYISYSSALIRFRLGMIMLVQLVYVERVAALVHVYGATHIHRTLNLDGLRAVSLLSVQSTPLTPHRHWLYLDHFAANVARLCNRGLVVGRLAAGDNSLSCGIKAKIGLIHELIVERWVDRGVVVLNSMPIVVMPTDDCACVIY